MTKHQPANRVTIVQFSKTFLDGTLKGTTVPGQTITFPTYKGDQREASFLCNTEDHDDFIRDAVTGSKFKVSKVRII